MYILYQVTLVSMLVLGVGLMAYAMISGRRADEEDEMPYGRVNAEAMDFVAASVDKVTKTKAEFQEISNHIFEEMEARHNELLDLYELVDKKKQEIDESYAINPEERRTYTGFDAREAGSPKHANPTVSTANIRKVRQLQQEGYSVSEIARSLGIGKSEVNLMLDLSKIR